MMARSSCPARLSGLLLLAFCLVFAALPAASAQKAQCIPACANGGVCTPVDGTDDAYCKCQPGFMGADCTATYQECDKGLVCYNGGKCVNGDTPESQTCACPASFTGATCKVPVVYCGNSTDFQCMNNGQCKMDPVAKEYYCQCAPGVRGRHCQFGVRECKDGMYCMNDGVCSADGSSCVCPSAFFGIHCQNNKRDPNAGRIPTSNLPPWAIALIVIACVLALVGAVLAGYLIHRERRGTPVFKQWQAANAAGGGTIPTTTI